MTLAVTTFLAILTLLAVLAILAGLVVTVFGGLPRVRELLGPTALWLAFAVALTATAGSLYLSEVVGLIPCTLCWYQRIAMYPLVVVLGIAAWHGDGRIRRYVAPIAAVGALIATYHVAVQRMPDLPAGACALDAPCTAILIERFGFVTIPVMALVAFLAILAVLLGLVPNGGDPDLQEAV
jgi:disulfide bond formation protein DsbB